MNSSVFLVLRVAYVSILLISPGAFIAFSRCCISLPQALRVACAVVLSPFVLSVELAVCALFHVSFTAFITYVVPMNVFGTFMVWRSWRTCVDQSRLLPALAIAVLLTMPLILLIVLVPHLRVYGWHNMIQLAALDQITRLPQLPEEMDLAGFRLNYPWLVFAQAATFASILNRPPTLFFFGINLLQLACMFLFIVAAARRLIVGTASPWGLAWACGAVLLVPGIFDIAGAVLGHQRPQVETRIVPMTGKFLFLDGMVFGLSSFSLVVFALVCRLCQKHQDDDTLIALVALGSLACGISYPLLFPSCAIVVTALTALCVVRGHGQHAPRLQQLKTSSLLFASFAAASILVGLYLIFLRTSSESIPVHLVTRSDLRTRLLQLTYTFGPVVALLIPLLPEWTRSRREPLLTLVAMFGLLLCCFALLAMPATVEYKFLFAALLVITPAIASGLASVVQRGRFRLVGLIGLFITIEAATSLSLWRWHIPREALRNAVPLDEGARFAHPQEGWATSWLRVAREGTPPARGTSSKRLEGRRRETESQRLLRMELLDKNASAPRELPQARSLVELR